MTILYDSLSSMVQTLNYRDGPYVGQNGYAKDGRWLYGVNWIATQAVERIPDECWTKGFDWIADEPQVALLEKTERRLKLRQLKKRAHKLANRDGEAYLYFDVGDNRESEPLDINNVGKDDLKFVNLFSMANLTKGENETDPISPYYGQPKWYQFSGKNGGTYYIHPSRIARFVSNPDPETGIGESKLKAVAGVICNTSTASENMVAITTQALLHVISNDGLMDAVSDPDTEQQMVKRFQVMADMIRTRGVMALDGEREKYQQFTPQFSTLPDVVESTRREVSAALKIPHALLFGREGGLGSNGEMELDIFRKTIATAQVNEIQEPCEMLDEVTIRSALGDRPDEIYIQWQPLKELSEKDRADVLNTLADGVGKFVNAGVVPSEIFSQPVITAIDALGALPGIAQEYTDNIDGIMEYSVGSEDDIDRNTAPA